MTITGLQAENVKRLKAVELTPEPGLNVVTGRNGQGKSSLLDSIEYALGGAAALKDTPEVIRKGEKKARIVVETDGYIITRTFTPNGTQLSIKTKDGQPVARPQELMDSVLGRISFDPLKFAQAPAKEQVRMLLSAAKSSINPDEIEAQKKALYDERTAVNRMAKQARSQMEAMPAVKPGLKPIDIQATLDAIRAIEAEEHAYNQKKAALHRMKEDFDRQQTIVRDLEERLHEERRTLELISAEGKSKQEELKAMAAPDIKAGEELRAKLSEAENINAMVRKAEEFTKWEIEYNKYVQLSDQLSQQMLDLDAAKANALAGAKLPVKGLSFDDNGVTFNGIPFSQCCSSEQLKVSLAIAMSLNPEMKVILIRDGSLLDSESLEVVRQMSDKAGYQVWCEIVDAKDGAGIVIEDGTILQ